MPPPSRGIVSSMNHGIHVYHLLASQKKNPMYHIHYEFNPKLGFKGTRALLAANRKHAVSVFKPPRLGGHGPFPCGRRQSGGERQRPGSCEQRQAPAVHQPPSTGEGCQAAGAGAPGGGPAGGAAEGAVQADLGTVTGRSKGGVRGASSLITTG